MPRTDQQVPETEFFFWTKGYPICHCPHRFRENVGLMWNPGMDIRSMALPLYFFINGVYHHH